MGNLERVVKRRRRNQRDGDPGPDLIDRHPLRETGIRRADRSELVIDRFRAHSEQIPVFFRSRRAAMKRVYLVRQVRLRQFKLGLAWRSAHVVLSYQFVNVMIVPIYPAGTRKTQSTRIEAGEAGQTISVKERSISASRL